MTYDLTILEDGTLSPFEIDVQVDRDEALPLYRQIAGPLERAILSGAVPAGSRIEDEVSMARRLEVSRPTARRALQDLVERGLVSRKRGVGTQVNPGHIHRRVGITSLDEDLRNAGFDTRTDILSYQVLLAGPDEVSLLRCSEGEEIVSIQRLRWANGEPLAILKNLILSDMAPSLTELTSFSLYVSLHAKGLVVTSASQNVSAKNAENSESDLLDMVPGDAVLTVKRWGFASEGEVIEYGDHVYNPALHSLTFNTSGVPIPSVQPQGSSNINN